MPRPLLTAILKSAVSQAAEIDPENGILRGVKLMCVNHTATFAGEDGKAKQVTITPAHIDALLAHAGNRAIPVHLTHDWFDSQGKSGADTAEMQARIGAVKKFRKDESGNLIADAYFKNGETRNDILWNAEHNPEDTMFSVVFSYLKDDPQCLPQNFRAADIVPKGAATTALFSETQTTETMPITIEDLKTLLADPQAKAIIQGALNGHSDAEEKAEAEMEDAAAAEMESAAGVTDEDKKKEDEQKPALMRAVLRVGRAQKRQLAAEKTALLAAAKAEATSLIGKGPILPLATGDSPDAETPEKFIAARLADGKAKTRAHAVALMGKTKPELYQAHLNR